MYKRQLNDYRLTRAGEYLKMTEENVTQIALKCGFENLSYFNRLFRRKFGVTPRQYREDQEAVAGVSGESSPLL